MDIIIYAQAFGINSSGDVYYKDRYIGENRDEKIDLSQFFKDTCNKKQMVDFEIFDCLEEKKVWAESIDKYFYLYVQSEEMDTDGSHIPIIIQAYHEDVDKIFDALNEFLERSYRHITEEARKNIEEEIKNFKKEKKIELRTFYFVLIFIFFVVFVLIYNLILKH